MIAFRVVIQPVASAEIEEAFVWIAKRNPEAAAKWFNGLLEGIERLANFPERHPLAPENDALRRKFANLSTAGGLAAIGFSSLFEGMPFTFCIFVTAPETN